LDQQQLPGSGAQRDQLGFTARNPFALPAAAGKIRPAKMMQALRPVRTIVTVRA
jgi:hypothetical protein